MSYPSCSKMEESTPHSSSRSRSALVLSPVALLVKGGQYGELVLPSLPPPGWGRREGEELVCGTASVLTGRWDRPTQLTMTLHSLFHIALRNVPMPRTLHQFPQTQHTVVRHSQHHMTYCTSDHLKLIVSISISMHSGRGTQ